MPRFLSAIIVATTLFLVPAIHGQVPSPSPAVKTNEVSGLSLPANQTVNFDEGFVSLHATTAGTVKWLVLSTSHRVKYKVNPATPNDIDVAIPPYAGSVTVFAIAVVNGQLTDYVRTDIRINGPPEPAPTPPTPNPPTPNPPTPTPAISLPLHLSFIEDPTKRTDAIKGVIESTALRTQLSSKNIQVRQYTINDPVVAQKNFSAILQKYGAPLMILQDNTGRALVISALPPDAPTLLKLISPYIPN